MFSLADGMPVKCYVECRLWGSWSLGNQLLPSSLHNLAPTLGPEFQAASGYDASGLGCSSAFLQHPNWVVDASAAVSVSQNTFQKEDIRLGQSSYKGGNSFHTTSPSTTETMPLYLTSIGTLSLETTAVASTMASIFSTAGHLGL